MTADILITKYVLDGDQYAAGAKKVINSTKDVERAQATSAKAQRTLQAGISSMSASLVNVSTLVTGLALAAGAGVASIAPGLVTAAADFEALELALRGVEGSADAAGDALKRIKALARGPGLGFEEATRGYLGLRRGGLSQGMSERVLREFGNAIASGGGGKEEFGRALLAMQQMATKPFLQGDELQQLTEAGLPAYKIVKDIFGTADTETLKKNGITSAMVIGAMVAELEKMPRVGGGAKNSIENLGDSINYAKVEMGKALAVGLIPMVDRLADLVGFASQGGIFSKLFSTEGLNGKDMMDKLFVNGLATIMTMRDTATDMFNKLLAFANLVNKITGGLLGAIAGQLGAGDPWMQKFEKNRSQIQSMMASGETLAKQEPPPASNEQDKKDQQNPFQGAGLRYLAKIEENTKQSVDMQRMAFGGGAIGQMGVSPAERAGVVVHGGGAAGMYAQAADLIRRAVGIEIAESYARRARGSM